jgi:hypothetical protein
VIRAFPDLKKEYLALHEQSVTASLSGMPGAGCVSRGTEAVALRQLPGQKQKEYDAVSKAVNATKGLSTERERLSVVDLVFWKQSHTLAGAALNAHISYDTAIDYHGDFIMLTAYFMDLVAYDELNNAQRIALKSHKNVLH